MKTIQAGGVANCHRVVVSEVRQNDPHRDQRYRPERVLRSWVFAARQDAAWRERVEARKPAVVAGRHRVRMLLVPQWEVTS